MENPSQRQEELGVGPTDADIFVRMPNPKNISSSEVFYSTAERNRHRLQRRRFPKLRKCKPNEAAEEDCLVQCDQKEEDEMYMRVALDEANKAALQGEVPVGALVVSKGKIVARGHNCVEADRDPTAHAEIVCVRSAATKLHSWRLLDATLYVTLEPCPMCVGALLQARVGGLVWGAPNKLLGADGSWVSLLPRISSQGLNGEEGSLCKVNGCAYANGPIHPFHPNIEVRRGVLADECAEAMKRFFQGKRKEHKVIEKSSVEHWFSSPTMVGQRVYTKLLRFLKALRFY